MGMNIKLVEKAAETFAAIGEPTRIRILETLAQKGEMNVGDISKAVGIVLVNVSHHLSVLRNAGIVEDRKVGRHNLYSVTNAWVSNITIKDGHIGVDIKA